LVDLGLVVRYAHPNDRRQVLVSVSSEGAKLFEAQRSAGRKWLQRRLEMLLPEERQILLSATDLMLDIINEHR
jgi:DNA-binding MarR family transcriptional regulator